MADKPSLTEFTTIPWRQAITSLTADQEKKRYTVLTFTLILIIIFGIFAIRPALVTTVNLNRQIKNAELIEESLERKKSDIDAARRNYAKSRAQLPILDQLLPSSEPLPALLRKLDQVALTSNAQIESLTIEEQKDFGQIPQIKEISLKTKVKVPLADFSGLMKSLTTSGIIIQIEGIQLSFGEGEKTEALAKLNLRTYYYLND